MIKAEMKDLELELTRGRDSSNNTIQYVYSQSSAL